MKLRVRVGDRLRVRLRAKEIIFEPFEDPVKLLTGLAERYLGGPRDMDVVKAVEEFLRREAGLH